MFKIELDEEKLKEIFNEKMDAYLQGVEHQSFFMTFTDLTEYLNMSVVSIREFLLWREDFPKIRLGSKWLFPRKEVELFMEKYLEEVKATGGDIHAMKRHKLHGK